MATGPDYCKLTDVTGRMYAGQGLAPGDPVPADATRDTLIQDLITKTSRDFDKEVAADDFYPGLFAPKYEVRTFSGKGEQELEIDPFLAVSSVMINSTPGRTPTWVDYSSELTSYKMGLLPVGPGWPKHRLFRQASFYEDPFPLGNVQVGGIWGICTPDPAATKPVPTWFGLATQAAIDALTPDGLGGGGWWVTPDDVTDAVANWVLFRFEHAKAAYSDTPGSSTQQGTQDTKYPQSIPNEVMRIIRRYQYEDAHHPKFALVGNDNDMIQPGYRWADWQTTP